MTDKVSEQLSAWMDGELPEEEVPLLLKRLEEDRELRLRLQRYQLVRDALKGGLPDMIDSRMADQVDAEIRNESLVFDEDPSDSPAPRRGWMKPFAGTAIAASVAMIAIVGVQMVNTSTQSGLPTSQQANVQPPIPTVAVPVRRASTDDSWEVSDPEVARRLDDYLIIHSERVSTATMQGVPPYVRVVGYERQE